jgi:hypothetical protein
MAISVTILGGPVQLTGNPVEIKVSGGSAPAGSTDYKLLLRVIDVDTSLLMPPVPDGIAPDSNGEAIFDISGKVDQPVKLQFQFPVTTSYVAYDSLAFTIKVQAGESYIDSAGNLQESWGPESTEFQLLKGGVSKRQIVIWRDANTNFHTQYITAKKFLTHRPWGDFVHPQQSVKLWFIPSEATTVNFRVRCQYDDNSETIFTTEITLDPEKIYEFNCNPAHLNVPLTVTDPETGAVKKLFLFDVRLDKNNVAYSDEYRFHFDLRYCKRPFFIFFQNSIGGIDDVYLGGSGMDKFSLERTAVTKPQARDARVYDPTIVTPHSLGQNMWTISTGYKSISQMLHLRDMLISRQKWLLYPNMPMTVYLVIPVIINNSESLLVNYSINHQELTLDISEAEKSQFSFDNRLAT